MLHLLPKLAAIFFLGCISLAPCTLKAAPITDTETVSDQVEISVDKYPARGQQLILWIAPNFGFRKGHIDMAKMLMHEGFEIWMADINDALFLTHSSTATREINAKYVADLIGAAHTKTGKQIVMMSGSYGASPVLRGVNRWLFRKPKTRYLLGTILFSPNVYEQIPPLGVEPKYLPIAYATTTPVIIIQGAMNNNRWQLDRLVDALRSGGSFVYAEIVPKTVDLFYGKERPPHVENYFRYFVSHMSKQIELFKNNPYPLRTKIVKSVMTAHGSGLDSQLKPFKGNPRPFPITLKDVNGKAYKIKAFKNHVSVVNFWATWCTPCIKEIPSLNKLRKEMHDKPFQLISISYAETPDAIKKFMQMIKVDFPVLVDKQGREAAKWKVISFPSTFVIGMDGLIHYGVNAGIDWDSPEVIKTINHLMRKK
jgi:thiol-disulfide isomerase/thioredoxin